MRRCCDCVTEGCTDCFQPDANSACCRLGPDDHLMLKIPRPGMRVNTRIKNPACAQCDPFDGPPGVPSASYTEYDSAPAILVKYEPFEGDAATNGYHWFCDDGSFGTVASENPIQHIGQLWRLWPPLCPGQTTRAGSPAPACCGNNCLCSRQNTSTVWYGGPADFYTDPLIVSVCGAVDTPQGNNPNLTNFQRDVIEENQIDPLYNNWFSATNCSNSCGINTARDMTMFCDYSGYEWLQGIYDDQTAGGNPSPKIYKHWYWDNAGAGQVVEADNLQRLAETIVAVYHPEKWYKRCESTYEYPIGDDQDCNRVVNWGCRTPEYFVYACAGVPIFSWEVRAMLDAGHITSAEFEWFFEARAKNLALGGGVVGKNLIQKLETLHWNASAPTGAAILQTKDWRGATLQDGSTVPTTEVRVIRKDLIQYRNGASNPATIVPDVFYKARQGGWVYVCRNPPRAITGSGTGICEFALTGAEIRQKAPQIIRNTGCTITDERCSTETVTDDTIGRPPYYVNDRCMTAAPVPVCTRCVSAGGCCDLCEDGVFDPGGSCEDCQPPPAVTCGGLQSSLCNQDSYSATCNAIHFVWRGYYYDYEEDQEVCIGSNSAYLWVVKDNCRDLDPDDSGPNSCELGCPANPAEGLPVAELGILPGTIATQQWRCGCQVDHCEASRGLAQFNLGAAGIFYCQTVNRNGNPSGNVPAIGPGQNQKGPYDQDGCGRYLCNEGKNFVLGACCINGECVEGVTEAECESCTGGVWQGWNSCCDGVSC